MKLYFTLSLLLILITTPAYCDSISNIINIDETLNLAINNAFRNIETTKTIAVVQINVENPSLHDFILGEVQHILVNNGYIVVERRELDQIRLEHAIQIHGEVDDRTAVAIGRFLGADVVVTGTIDGYEELTRLRLKLLDTETAVIIGSASERFYGIYLANTETDNTNNSNNFGLVLAFETKFSEVNNDLGIFMGGKAGLVYDKSKSVGFALYALLPEPKINLHCPVPDHNDLHSSYIESIYGGLFFDYMWQLNQRFSLSAGSLIGVAGLKISHDTEDYHSPAHKNHGSEDHSMKCFLIIEPNIESNLLIYKKLKAFLGVSYRITGNLMLKYDDYHFANSSILKGLSVNVGVKYSVGNE